MKKSRKRWLTAIVGIIFLLQCLWYYQPVYQELLLPIHAWAQADRLSVAFQFYENGFHFFKPQSFSVLPIDQVVGIELPLQSYLTALLALLFGKAQIPLLYKLITLSLWFVALLSLCRLIFDFSKNMWLSLLPLLFAFCSPLLMYYSFNYLPDIAGFSLLVIGFCQAVYFAEKEESKLKKALLALWIGVFAALTKLLVSFYLPFLVVFLLHAMYRKGGLHWKKHVAVLLAHAAAGMGSILGYYFYIKYLQKAYDSYIFLSKANPLSGSWGEIKSYLLDQVLAEWQFDYLSLPGYGLALLCLAGAFAGGFFFRKKAGKYALLALGFLLGGLAGIYLMGNQLIAHDYYLINILFPILMFALAAAAIIWGKVWAKITIKLNVFLLLALAFCFYLGIKQAEQQYRLRCKYKNIVKGPESNWLKEAMIESDSLPLARDEAILLPAGLAPNEGLVYFQRRGITFPWKKYLEKPDQLLEFTESKKVRHLILFKEQQVALAHKKPCFFDYFEQIYEGNNYLIYRRNSLIGWHQEREADTIRWFTSFENTQPCDSSLYLSKSGKGATRLGEKKRFSQGFLLPVRDLGLIDTEKPWKIKGEVCLLAHPDSCSGAREIKLWSFLGDRYTEQNLLSLSMQLAPDEKWQKMLFEFSLPQREKAKEYLKLFFSYPDEKPGIIYIDDLSLSFYEDVFSP